MNQSITLSAGQQVLVLEPTLGGRAVSWKVDGVELLASKSDHPVEHGMYPMGPWAGRINANSLKFQHSEYELPPTYEQWALHGTTYFKQWQVVEKAEDACILSCELGDPWPWPGSIEVSWHLLDDQLITTVQVRSESVGFPAVTGLHPWFATKNQFGRARWELPECRLAERDDSFELSGRLIDKPESSGMFDDAFYVPSQTAVIHWGDALVLEVHQSHEWFVVYDKESDFICVEPQTAPPNGVNDALIGSVWVVTPERPLIQEVTWRIFRGLPGNRDELSD